MVINVSVLGMMYGKSKAGKPYVQAYITVPFDNRFAYEVVGNEVVSVFVPDSLVADFREACDKSGATVRVDYLHGYNKDEKKPWFFVRSVGSKDSK